MPWPSPRSTEPVPDGRPESPAEPARAAPKPPASEAPGPPWPGVVPPAPPLPTCSEPAEVPRATTGSRPATAYPAPPSFLDSCLGPLASCPASVRAPGPWPRAPGGPSSSPATSDGPGPSAPPAALACPGMASRRRDRAGGGGAVRGSSKVMGGGSAFGEGRLGGCGEPRAYAEVSCLGWVGMCGGGAIRGAVWATRGACGPGADSAGVALVLTFAVSFGPATIQCEREHWRAKH